MKTLKAAGTSVEIYFEKECVDPALYDEPKHPIDETCSEHGIIGYRGKHSEGKRWYNHMPASQIRSLVDEKVWKDYFKFCVVRNPFDKAVSYWWMSLTESKRLLLAGAGFPEIKAEFKRWIMSNNSFPVDADRGIYTIDGTICVDYCVRYEMLLDDLKVVCDRIGVEFQASRLGRYKSENRRRTESFCEYYDSESQRKAESMFEYELGYFRYSLF